MLTATPAEIESRAQAVAHALRDSRVDVQVVATKASVGGGAFPTAEIPSSGIVLGGNAEATEKKLRDGEPPVIGRITEGKLLLDLRSVRAREDAALVRAVIMARP
jgi:L-seryl-tRNA(Ser) seleniumtransferase